MEYTCRVSKTKTQDKKDHKNTTGGEQTLGDFEWSNKYQDSTLGFIRGELGRKGPVFEFSPGMILKRVLKHSIVTNSCIRIKVVPGRSLNRVFGCPSISIILIKFPLSGVQRIRLSQTK